MQTESVLASIAFDPLEVADHQACLHLWAACDGVVLRAWEDVTAFDRLLQRNPGLNWAAHSHGRLIATVLCGHDGWRGWLYHVAVDPAWRRRGIATALVVRAQTGLSHAGIRRAHALMLSGNREAAQFWSAAGWQCREDLTVVSATLNAPPLN